MTFTRSWQRLTRSISSLVTYTGFSPLFSTEPAEEHVLQMAHLPLQLRHVRFHRPSRVRPLERAQPRTRDPEDRRPAAVRALKLQLHELAAARQGQRAEPQVLGADLDHPALTSFR